MLQHKETFTVKLIVDLSEHVVNAGTGVTKVKSHLRTVLIWKLTF